MDKNIKNKILIICSTNFYDKIEDIKIKLESFNYEVILPNCYDNPVTSEDNKNMSEEEYCAFFKEMYDESREKIKLIDEILILNFDKTKNLNIYKNYVGASTFLEMYEAFMNNKKIYMLNELPDESNMLFDDIKGMNPILLHGNVENIKK